ncbi:MutS domain III [Dictyocaulus viviparus]|uniref:MutS domain III n=1 Tax=Dictyocaulus viviparus TaxID=29172 RepID=A0A0D8YEX4_DICVI|nr:MutS domain III [Dictyocaulus viviparus]
MLGHGARNSLLTVVDETLTSGGSRLLRSILLQPSGDQDVIEHRLDAVEELINNAHLVDKLRDLLSTTYDLEHFFNVFVESPHVSTVQTADFNVTQLLRLKQILNIVPHLRQITKNFKCDLMSIKCKEGVSVNLDIARRAYGELLRDIECQEEELSTHLPGKNTRLAFSTARGFHYVWVCGEAGSVELPPIFINVVRNRSSVTFTSRNLLRYNGRLQFII